MFPRVLRHPCIRVSHAFLRPCVRVTVACMHEVVVPHIHMFISQCFVKTLHARFNHSLFTHAFPILLVGKDNYHEQGNIIIILLLLPLGHISNTTRSTPPGCSLTARRGPAHTRAGSRTHTRTPTHTHTADPARLTHTLSLKCSTYTCMRTHQALTDTYTTR